MFCLYLRPLADSEKLPVQRHRNAEALKMPESEVPPVEKKSKKPKKKEKKHKEKEKDKGKKKEKEKKVVEEEEEEKKVIWGFLLWTALMVRIFCLVLCWSVRSQSHSDDFCLLSEFRRKTWISGSPQLPHLALLPSHR